MKKYIKIYLIVLLVISKIKFSSGGSSVSWLKILLNISLVNERQFLSSIFNRLVKEL